jgi:hypothetical protein
MFICIIFFIRNNNFVPHNEKQSQNLLLVSCAKLSGYRLSCFENVIVKLLDLDIVSLEGINWIACRWGIGNRT